LVPKHFVNVWSQSTLYGNRLSKSAHINYEVPQGSILGPILYLIYINDFHYCLLNADAITYADDTSIFLHHKDLNILLKNAQIDIENMSNWLVANKHTLNIEKTKLIHKNKARI